jgi:hypothetical protein
MKVISHRKLVEFYHKHLTHGYVYFPIELPPLAEVMKLKIAPAIVLGV